MTKESGCSARNRLGSTRGTKKEQEPVWSLPQAKQGEGGGESSRDYLANATPQIPAQCPARINAEQQLGDVERSTDTLCPSSAGARWVTSGENTQQLCCNPAASEGPDPARCGVTQTVRTAHSSLLCHIPAATGNTSKSLASVSLSTPHTSHTNVIFASAVFSTNFLDFCKIK